MTSAYTAPKQKTYARTPAPPISISKIRPTFNGTARPSQVDAPHEAASRAASQVPIAIAIRFVTNMDHATTPGGNRPNPPAIRGYSIR